MRGCYLGAREPQSHRWAVADACPGVPGISWCGGGFSAGAEKGSVLEFEEDKPLS